MALPLIIPVVAAILGSEIAQHVVKHVRCRINPSYGALCSARDELTSKWQKEEYQKSMARRADNKAKKEALKAAKAAEKAAKAIAKDAEAVAGAVLTPA
jgi:predicted Holliday junction resolvase-like endonuclease